MAQKADGQQGHPVPTLYGFLLVERAEPPPAMTFAVVKTNWSEPDQEVEGGLEVAIYVRIDALSPKLEAEVQEYMRHVAPPSPADLHPDTRAEICPTGWKTDDETE